MNRRAAPGFTNILRITALIALAGALFGLPSAPALADAAQGFSVGGGVGEYNLRITNAADLGAALDSYSTNNTAYQAFIQYRFAPFLALEGQYMNLAPAAPLPVPLTSPPRPRAGHRGWSRRCRSANCAAVS